MIALTPLYLSNVAVKESCGFFINLQKEVKTITAVRLGIPDTIVTQYDAALAQLIDQVYTVRASIHTATMNELDEKRMNIYRRIHLRLQLVQYGDDVRSIANAANAVKTYILSRYSGSVIDLSKHDRTVVISGFVTDLNTYLTEDDIETLGIGNDINSLSTANAAFVTAYNAKLRDKAETPTGVSQAMRDTLLELFNRISTIVMFYANSEAEADATRAADCQQFIAHVNVMIDEMRIRDQSRETMKSTLEAKAQAGQQTTDNRQQ